MKINQEIQQKVELDSRVIERIVLDIVEAQTKELDEYVQNIKKVLEMDSDDLTTDELNRIMIRLCSYAYFIASKQELMGIRQDISEAIRAERYNEAYVNLTVGTVAKKTAEAESIVKEEVVVALIYSRAYKIMKGKYDSVNRLIDAVKKILTAKIQTMQLTGKCDI